MKKFIMPMAVAIAAISFTACGGSNSDATTDSSTVSTTTTSSMSDSAGSATSSTEASGTRVMKESYMDLSTGSKVRIERDAQTGKYVNRETRQPIEFYFDPETNDTFDVTGRVVNMALTRSANGGYMVDESRVKVQGDGDLKITSDQSDTKVKLETDGDTKVKTGDAKEKTKGDNYKYKDDSTKIKVKDGKVTVKQKGQ